jgi:hypothetical protein
MRHGGISPEELFWSLEPRDRINVAKVVITRGELEQVKFQKKGTLSWCRSLLRRLFCYPEPAEQETVLRVTVQGYQENQTVPAENQPPLEGEPVEVVETPVVIGSRPGDIIQVGACEVTSTGEGVQITTEGSDMTVGINVPLGNAGAVLKMDGQIICNVNGARANAS